MTLLLQCLRDVRVRSGEFDLLPIATTAAEPPPRGDPVRRAVHPPVPRPMHPPERDCAAP